MKILKLILLISILSFISCKDEDCPDLSPTCQEVPPTNELCLAFFTRWFYDADSNSCQEIGYSGCAQYGFATKEECESCECD